MPMHQPPFWRITTLQQHYGDWQRPFCSNRWAGGACTTAWQHTRLTTLLVLRVNTGATAKTMQTRRDGARAHEQ
jgi:hypothetical protein